MTQSHHFVSSLSLILNNNNNEIAASVTTFGFRKYIFIDISTLSGWDNNIMMIIMIMHLIDYCAFLTPTYWEFGIYEQNIVTTLISYFSTFKLSLQVVSGIVDLFVLF